MNNELSIAILGWKSPVTTRYSLETYRKACLYDCCGEFFVYYNQYSREDKALCDEMGVRSCGTSANTGNWGGQRGILDHAKGDYVLFLENDHPAVVSPEETKKWIDGSLRLLKEGKADVVQLRNRQFYGEGYGFRDFFKYHYVRKLDARYRRLVGTRILPSDCERDTVCRMLRRLVRPGSAARRLSRFLYLEESPELVLPRWIRRDGEFFIVDSQILNFSESPFMISKTFYQKLSAWAERHPCHRTILGHQNLEYILNCRWWRDSHFRIAVCESGVFGHERKDDSWRPTHAAYNSALTNQT